VAASNLYNEHLNDVTWHKTGLADYVLPENTVHVWRIQISTNLSLLQHLSNTLNDAEKVRGNKYIYERDRNRFVVSRGAQRFILSKYLNTHPTLLDFALGDNKKPYIVTNDGQGLQFNLSHSGDWILLAVSARAVGSDIEYVDSTFNYEDILPQHFSEEESAYINQENSTERFYTLWTRKEALLKATGQGLGNHLKHAPALNGLYTMHPSLSGNASNWQIKSFYVHDGYIGSIAVEGISAVLQFWDIDLGN
jgi:4'-phosphopantetheinyl transferase